MHTYERSYTEYVLKLREITFFGTPAKNDKPIILGSGRVGSGSGQVRVGSA